MEAPCGILFQTPCYWLPYWFYFYRLNECVFLQFDTNGNLYCPSLSPQLPLRDVDGSKSLITRTERRQANKSLSADVKRKTWNGAFCFFGFLFLCGSMSAAASLRVTAADWPNTSLFFGGLFFFFPPPSSLLTFHLSITQLVQENQAAAAAGPQGRGDYYCLLVVLKPAKRRMLGADGQRVVRLVRACKNATTPGEEIWITSGGGVGPELGVKSNLLGTVTLAHRRRTASLWDFLIYIF